MPNKKIKKFIKTFLKKKKKKNFESTSPIFFRMILDFSSNFLYKTNFVVDAFLLVDEEIKMDEESTTATGVISEEEEQGIDFESSKVNSTEKSKESFRSKYLYCADFPFSVWFIFANEFGERYCFYGKEP